MNACRLVAAVGLVALATTAGFAGDDPSAAIADARQMLKDGSYAEAAAAFEKVIRAHPKSDAVFGAYVGAFDAHVGAGDDARAQKAGKRIFRRYPDAKGTFPVLATWIEHGWKIPSLATSYDVLRYWTFERFDGKRNPDLRLALLEIIASQHKRSDMVKDGGILYCQAWCHLTAGRPDDAIKVGQKYLRSEPRGGYVDRTRFVVGKAMLAMNPPQTQEATKLLRLVAENEDSKQRGAAKDLLAKAGAAPPSIQITKGYPTAAGLGQMVVLTNLGKGSARRKAIEPWVKARKAEVVSFRGDVASAAAKLRKHGAEFVAVVVEPGVVDNDFQLSMLELCRGLDDDPLPDFHYGYLVARDAADLAAFTSRILEKEAAGGTAGREVSIPTSERSVAGLDFFIHYGHGTARKIVKGVTARELAQFDLPNAPVIVSGACFNGVVARTHERYILGNHHGKPEELAPEEVLSLAWIHAGATGLFAALDGDRGEMAGAEWEYFREHAPSLGAVIGHQYRLIFTSLRESFEGFPRYTPGTPKNKSFYSVMLRGQTSRILISDPMYRPLHAPLAKPTTRTSVSLDPTAGTVTLRVEVLRRSNGPFVNTLPTKSGTPFKEKRLYARVALPEGFEETLGFPEVESGGIELSKIQAKHEVWGGRRYVNVQAESENYKLTSKGATTTFVFPVVR